MYGNGNVFNLFFGCFYVNNSYFKYYNFGSMGLCICFVSWYFNLVVIMEIWEFVEDYVNMLIINIVYLIIFVMILFL